jgi:predicted aspartyl protease
MKPGAKSFARIAISNVPGGGGYTGQIQVGPDNRTMNVLLDTGSSQLALDATSSREATARPNSRRRASTPTAAAGPGR